MKLSRLVLQQGGLENINSREGGENMCLENLANF
jgi:hypothetical protein